MTTALYVGAARRAITPPPHIDMAGYAARTGAADGTLDDLYCRAIVFDDGSTSLVLAICDLLYVTTPLREQVGGLVRQRLGVSSDHILLTATHTHCGPAHLASGAHTDLVATLAEGITAVREQISARPRQRRQLAPRAAELWIEDLLATHAAHFDSLDPPGTTLPVQLLRIGDDAAIVGLPGEPFTAIGERIREASGGTLLVAGYANHSAGYLPTIDEFPRSGYEIGCRQYSAGTAERLVDAATALLKAPRVSRPRAPRPAEQQ